MSISVNRASNFQFLKNYYRGQQAFEDLSSVLKIHRFCLTGRHDNLQPRNDYGLFAQTETNTGKLEQH